MFGKPNRGERTSGWDTTTVATEELGDIARKTPAGRLLGLCAALCVMMSLVANGQEPPDTNYDESKVTAYTLPDPLVCTDGRVVTDARMWQQIRRPEVLTAFATVMYGVTPAVATQLRFEVTSVEPAALGGLATRKEIAIHLFDDPAAPVIDLLLFLPKGESEPVPVFLGLNYGNQGVHADPSIRASRGSLAGRGEHATRWPLELILRRGYGVATFWSGDIELDHYGSGAQYTPEAWERGLRGYLRRQAGAQPQPATEWGALGVWAWGLSRALDYLATDPAVNATKVCVFGHSRTGKTALWAGAQDERFAMVISNNSGQGGASLARRRFGETVAASVSLSGDWYCRNYQQYANREADLPVDQHMLVALIAPRPVYIASAQQDGWADPRGEFLAGVHADPVYRLFGKTGLGVEEMPPVDHPVGDTIGYHIRTGDHDITEYDWRQYLDFADRHWHKHTP